MEKIKNVKKYAEKKGIVEKNEIKIKLDGGKIFNPDKLVLSKDEILGWVDSCVYDGDGMKYKALVSFMTLSLKAQSHADLNKLWSRLLTSFNELILKNSQAIMTGKDEGYNETLKKMFELRKK